MSHNDDLESRNVSIDRRMNVIGQLDLFVDADGREDPQELQTEPADDEGHDLIGPHLIPDETGQLTVFDGKADRELFAQTGDHMDPSDVFGDGDLDGIVDAVDLNRVACAGKTILQEICEVLNDEIIWNLIRLNLIGHSVPL